MRKKLAICLVVAAVALATAAIAPAQETSTTQKTTTTSTTTQTDNSGSTGDTHSNVRTLTGCLRAGDSAKEYELVGQDGSTWEVKSDAVELASHVGHTVTLTGVVAHPMAHGMKEDARNEAQEHGMDKAATEHGHLTATNVTMVSSSCSQ